MLSQNTKSLLLERQKQNQREMSKAERNKLIQCLNSNLNTIHETFQIFDQAPASSLEKVKWYEVIKMGDAVARQATIVGMIWTGEPPLAIEVEENMVAYFNTLQGFLLLSHGSTVHAGPTLSSCILTSVKKVVDCSFQLLQESVLSFGTCSENDPKIPQLAGAVWAACSALERTPATNITAIGRAMTQVAVSVRDVLRELKELKTFSTDLTDQVSVQTSAEAEIESQDDENSSEADLGNDLSLEEMIVAQAAISVVSETLVVIKELIRSITGLLKLENRNDTGDFVDSLEKLLKQCQGIGTQIDELGACLYPPQEVPAIREIVGKISSFTDDMQKVLETLNGTSETFLQACSGLKSSLTQLISKLDCPNLSEIEAKLQNVDLDN